MPAPEQLSAWRVAASSSALDQVSWPEGALVLRLAPDEVLVMGETEPVIDDPYAVIEPDGGWAALELDPGAAGSLFAANCEWEVPAQGLGQGLVAGVPAKVWVEPDRVLVIVPAPLAHELERWRL